MSLVTAERRIPKPRRERPSSPQQRKPLPVERAGGLFVSAVLVIYCFLQEPGRIIADTKLDLYVAPSQFLHRALHLWDAHAGFGQIQNQAFGYLFPMGPFFAIAHALHVPAWVAQRVWMSGLLLLGFWGALKVAEAMRIGSPWTRLVGAAAYALSPAMLSLIAVTSGNELPAALLPWVLLPLVRHRPSTRPSRTAARSALAVVAMGGINAIATAAVLAMPAVWLLTRTRGEDRRRLIGWWVPCVLLATFWWLGPLWLQSKYGFHFLDFTESAKVTTATSSTAEAVRGTGYWVSYLHVNGPWLRGAWELVASPLVILASAALAAAGLYGLARRDLPYRRFLGVTAVLGVLFVTAGYTGPLSSQLGPPIQSLLRGPLSPFRNLNKFEPILRLSLALALAHALWVLDVSSFVRRVGTAALLVAIAAAPLWQGHLAPDGSFKGVPSYWRHAATWLGDRAAKGRTLIVPSAAFGEYTWGRPLDEPMQALATSDWAVRDIVPLGSVGETRLLDTVERPLELGQPSPGLAAFLARAGVHYVLLRNDLDPFRSGAPAPAYVRRSLDGSPGLVRVTSFGPHVDYVMSADRMTPDLGRSVRADARSLEVYEVYSPAAKVASYSVDGAVTVTGAPDALLPLDDAGTLGRRAAVLAGDPLAPKITGGIQAQSDAVQRRDDQYGWVRNNLSYPLTRREQAPGTDETPQQRLIVDRPSTETTVRMTGATAIAASSYENALSRSPARQPYAAFDGDPSTAWVTGSLDGPIGQWLEVRVAKAISPRTLDVQLMLDPPTRPRVSSLRITTAAGSVMQPVRPTEAPQTLELPHGKTTWVRLTIASVDGGQGLPGLREVRIPGVQVDRTLGLPSVPKASSPAADVVVLSRVRSDAYDLLHADEETALNRIFSLPRAADLSVTGTVQPVPGFELDNLVASLTPPSQLQVVPSSTWRGIPAFGARSLVDGDASTAWLASADDRQPSIQLSWPDTRTLDSIQVTPPDGPALRPVKIRLQSGLAIRDVDVGSGDVVPFEPLRGNQVTVTFVATAPTEAGDKAPGYATQLAVGIGDLRFPALDDLRSPRPNAVVHLACGDGPTISVDGTTLDTSVDGSFAGLQALAPLEVSSCGAPLHFGPGEHRLSSIAQGGLVLTTATLAPTQLPPIADARSTTLAGKWGNESRRVRIGPGGASFLALTENFNRGWTATLHGRRLQALRLDGWRQAWLVPAGAGGLVRLDFAPGHTYGRLLLVGLAGVAVLLVLALARWRRRAGAPRADDVVSTASSVTYVAGVVAALGVSVVLGGVLGVLACAGLLVLRRYVSLAHVAAGAFALAGIAVFLSPGRLPGSGSGAFGAPAQLLATVAVVAVAVSLVRARGEL